MTKQEVIQVLHEMAKENKELEKKFHTDIDLSAWHGAKAIAYQYAANLVETIDEDIYLGPLHPERGNSSVQRT